MSKHIVYVKEIGQPEANAKVWKACDTEAEAEQIAIGGNGKPFNVRFFFFHTPEGVQP